MLVIDAPHDAAPILEAVGGRTVTAIVLTHGHNDHITAAVALREATGAPIWFHRRPTGCSGTMVHGQSHPDAAPDHDLVEGTTFDVAGHRRWRRCTPRATPRAAPACYAPDLEHGLHRRHPVLRRARAPPGGPSATSRRSSASIRTRLLTLPGDTVVKTGHGDDTTIAAEVDNIH